MKNSNLTNYSTMKKLFLSSALSITSLTISPSVLGGPGEPPNGENTLNDCNTSVSTCLVTPTKFSTKIYKVALCESNPMEAARALAGLVPDWDGSNCVDVYNSVSGEETGDIFSDTGATLSAENITIPEAGNFGFVAALFDKDFKAASHHMVYRAGGPPLNNKRYVSTSGGGAQEGGIGEEQMISGEFNTFSTAIDCSNGSNMAERTSTTGAQGTYSNFLSGGETFFGRVLKEDFTLATQNLGNINNNNATCGGVKYLLSIVNKSTKITENSAGIHIKILAPKGLMRVDQGNVAPAGDGVVTGFTTHGESMAVSVSAVAGN